MLSLFMDIFEKQILSKLDFAPV